MAGPAFRSVGTRSQSAGAATLTPALPTVDGAGGLLLCVVTSKNNATHTTSTSGWSKVGSTINSGASFCASLFVAREGAAAPVITWTGSVACSAQIAYYTDPAGIPDTTIGASQSNNGTTSTHSTTGITTTRNDSDVVYVDVAAANTAIATPAGWTEDVDGGSATDAGRTAFGNKPVATSGTASGAISVTGANAAWVQWQVEIMRAAAAGGLEVSKAAVAAFVEPAAGFDVSKAAVGAWLETNDVRFSQVYVAAWLDSTALATDRRRMSLM